MFKSAAFGAGTQVASVVMLHNFGFWTKKLVFHIK
jgi:hypothetical protein